MGGKDSERTCGQWDDQAGQWKPEPGETMAHKLNLLSGTSWIKYAVCRSPWLPSARSLTWLWLSDWIPVFHKNSKICTLWAATWKVMTSPLYCVFLNNPSFYNLTILFIGIGNVTLCAEFNFAMDPESAYVVLEEFLCTTYVASWEYSCRNSLTWVRFIPVTTNVNLPGHSVSDCPLSRAGVL